MNSETTTQAESPASDAPHCSTALQRWDVLTEDGTHTVHANTCLCSERGLQFFCGEECVAWFNAWLWFKKFDSIGDANRFGRLKFSRRTQKALADLDCKTISHLLALSDDEILLAKNSGMTVLNEICETLNAAGLKRESSIQ